MANRAAGKGYENVAHYENIDFHFIGIENIHVMRQSLQKLIEGMILKFTKEIYNVNVETQNQKISKTTVGIFVETSLCTTVTTTYLFIYFF